uniref:Uncharacterized protein n=1 Tax=Anguilla anguilla TaxID=7936 RepID=A0A0E9PDY0_ANGAN
MKQGFMMFGTKETSVLFCYKFDLLFELESFAI